MSWERRHGKHYYYYQAWRDGTRVRKQYIGRGHAAEMIAQQCETERQERLRERQKAATARAILEAAEAELGDLCCEVNQAVHEALTAAGYHLHKREWRKRRG